MGWQETVNWMANPFGIQDWWYDTTHPDEGDGDDIEIPDPPEPREYGQLTGAEFFGNQDLYGGEQWSEYYDPFLAGGHTWEELAEMYAGLPVVRGYWTGMDQVTAGDLAGGTPSGHSGVFTATQSLYNIASQLFELGELPGQIQSWDEWLASHDNNYVNDLTQTDPYQQIAGLYEDMQDLSDEQQEMLNAAALANGFYNEDGTGDGQSYLEYLNSMREESDLGIMGQSGIMGTDYETAQREANAAAIRQIVNSNMQMIESMGMKSSAAAFAKMSEVSDMIENETLQQEAKLWEQDMMMRQLEYEVLVGRLDSAKQTGQLASAQHADLITANRMQALEASSIQLQTIITNNQQIFQQYTADLQALELEAGMMYQSIMAQIGYDAHLLEMAMGEYELYMQPYYDAIAAALAQAQIDELNKGGGIDWGQTLEYMGIGAGIGAPGGVPGVVIGGLIGGLASLLDDIFS